MHDYNKDYYVLVDDFSKDNNMDYGMGLYGTLRATSLRNGPLNKLLKFEIDERNWKKGRKPEDAILFNDSLIFKDNLKERFITLGQDDIVMHNIYFVSPDEQSYEGYWYIPTPEKPKEWLDVEKSVINYEDDDPNKEVYSIREYRFNNYALNAVDEKQRQIFMMPYENFGFTHLIVHNNVMKFLKTLDSRNFKFIPLLLFKSKMFNEGPLPEFAF